MQKATVISVYKQNNKIVGYKIRLYTGEIIDYTSEQVKKLLTSNLLTLDNYKLTSDNRLIQRKIAEISENKSNSIAYYLMNKDNKVLKFTMQLGIVEVYGVTPYGFNTIENWISNRKKFSCAHNVKEFFNSIGIYTDEDFIYVTHCVSLNDSFWICSEKENIKWNSVSPFRHSYSKLISTYALDGIDIGLRDKNYFSPVISTDGSFPHTWEFRGQNNIVFIKAGSKYTLGGSNSGREPFSEYYASQIGKFLNFNCVDYSIRNHKRHDNRIDIVTECKCFTTEEVGATSASNLGLTTYESVIDYCKNLNKQSYDTIINMLFLDCLTLNTDRHFGNISFLVDNATQRVISIAPIFDNNYSLLPRFIEGYDKFDRSEYIARDNRTFEDLYKLVLKHKDFSYELKKLKGFRFNKPETVDRRLAFLNNFLQKQVDYLLK
jgi:hypothetical protein